MCLTLCDPMDCSTPGLPVPHHLLEFAQVHVHWTVHVQVHAIQLSHPLFLLPLIFPSIRDFSNELSVHIRWSKYWTFIFSLSPSSEYSGLISLKIDWLDLLAVQGTFRRPLETLPNRAFGENFLLCYIILICYWVQILLLILKIESVKPCKILPNFLPYYT